MKLRVPFDAEILQPPSNKRKFKKHFVYTMIPKVLRYFSTSLPQLLKSSHLRTNSINFSSISEDNQAGLIASKHSKWSGDDVITAHMIRIEHVGLVPSRQTFSLGGGDGTETFLSVWTSPFNYTWEKFTERWRSATERKRDVLCELAHNHQPTRHPPTFLPNCACFMAVVNVQMFSPTMGK